MVDAALVHRLPRRQFIFVDSDKRDEILKMIEVLAGRSGFTTKTKLVDDPDHDTYADQITYMGYEFFLIQTDKNKIPQPA